MAKDITIVDQFEQTDSDQLKRMVSELMRSYSIHNHDGRGSTLITTDSIADIIPRMHLCYNFETTTRYFLGGSGAGAASSFDANQPLNLQTGTTDAGRYTCIGYHGAAVEEPLYFNKSPDFTINAQSVTATAGEDKHAYLITGYIANGASETLYKHIGFKLVSDASAGESVYATWHNGTTQGTHKLQIEGVNVNPRSARHLYYAKLYSGDRIDFYVDGVLAYTARTGLPSGGLDQGAFMSLALRSTSGTTSYSVNMTMAQVSFDQY